ncbi:LOW QUALITY PROTEIN: probable L-gulonolactone oxidase 6 [Arabidopsis lyrata subsp. lyrata]|uniref:LOW QUALITY PROTEIN: probable L-gulonolactone oxidase 6 n=1 Tax=Arabidopsis lyrata subsp. lyrata TaxID=81972 RepID=UPI000A29A3B6|nr:LOW QUALITY PROTEIN: probable L-gulonolactone oxidase 6 [Arabidopsis lyrata subsp. lyrata]|eukprot:XP_020886881.1 LOW QUALITY PROTEIN: probable L-gulonolactone oxidase 6 [Arabidopsis lyrata subsp. lyrata]
MMLLVAIGVLSLHLLFSVSYSSPPENPVSCGFRGRNCTVLNSYGAFSDRAICRASVVAYPTTENDLLQVVAEGTRARQKMRVVTRFSHSTTKLACVDGKDGRLISAELLNKTLSVDRDAMTITVQSGVSLRQLIGDAAKVGLALRMAPHWWGLTVGGMMSTGAHGSSWDGERGGTAFHDYVIEMRMVTSAPPDQGYSMIRTLNRSNFSELDAARVSLGVFGVISQVTVQLELMFKRSITYMNIKDSDLVEMVEKHGDRYEFPDIMWYPSQGEVVYRMDERVSMNISGSGSYDSVLFEAKDSKILAFQRSKEEELEFERNSEEICTLARDVPALLYTLLYGLSNDGMKYSGYPDLMSSGGCLDSKEDGLATACPWDSRIHGQFFHQTTFTIPIESVKEFISDIKTLVKIEPKALCGLNFYNGVLIRYVQPSFAYLGIEFEGMEFEFTYYRSRDPLMPRMYEDFFEDIEQIGLFKYGGLPHWGKNRNVAFINATEKYKDAALFLKMKQMFDPLHLFSSKWTDAVLGLGGDLTVDTEGCALEGLCICSKDVHCSPSRGYFCRAGKIYKAARVCTHV